LIFISFQGQEIQIRDLQNDKRIHAKKVQEFEELKRVLKATEDKIDDFELKLNEKETENCSLKTKITKLEADLSRIDHEYQKMRNKFL
jgi:chromosome segregation ATPase